jgi:ABC-type transport system substrate-binding protein
MTKRTAAGFFVVLFCLFATPGCTRKTTSSTSEKILHVALDSDIKGFDPAASADEYSHVAIIQVYQALFQYNYLKRPYEIEPLLAESMPQVSRDGRTVRIRLRSGVFFQEDAAFAGKRRELKASDVVYSLKRLADPRVKSPNWWLFEGRVVGLDQFRKQLEVGASPQGYDAIPVEGLVAADDRTVVITLTRPYRQLMFALAMQGTSVVAREVVEKYGPEFLNHPVGTGPFILREWVRGQKIVLAKNPHYWRETHAEINNGKPLPCVDGVVLSIFVETQPRWLNFLKGNLDYSTIPKEAYDDVFDPNMKLKTTMKEKGIRLSSESNQDVIYLAFNLVDPLLGRNRPLRRAISAAINREEKIALFYRGRGIVARGPIPPDYFGYDQTLKDPNGYDLSLAKKWAAEARREYQMLGGKGEIPPITYDILNGAVERQIGEAIAQDLGQIGIRINLRANNWPQFEKRIQTKNFQFGLQSWLADYPDPENFLQLLYGKNISPGPNASNLQNAHYDFLYERMKNLPDTAEREKIIREMVALIHQETPWVFIVHRTKVVAQQEWLKNFKYHTIEKGSFKYLDLNEAQKQRLLSRRK